MITAEISFPTGHVVPVEGKIFRIDRDNIVVILTEPISGELLVGLGIDGRAYFRLRNPLLERPS